MGAQEAFFSTSGGLLVPKGSPWGSKGEFGECPGGAKMLKNGAREALERHPFSKMGPWGPRVDFGSISGRCRIDF